MTDIDGARLAQVAAELDPSGERVRAYALDVSSSTDCDRALARAAQDFGGLDHLVHCAGIYPESLVRDTSDQGWKKLMGVNLDGTFYVCRAAERHLRENGSIVLLTSLAAQRGSYAHAAYSASKGAVQSFTRSLALELAPARERGRARHHRHLHDQRPDRPEGRPAAGQHAAAPLRLGRGDRRPDRLPVLALAAFVTGEVMQVNGGIYIA